MADTFLTRDEIVILTGRKMKSKQAEALRAMGIPFYMNACNIPVVPRSVIESQKNHLPDRKPTWDLQD